MATPSPQIQCSSCGAPLDAEAEAREAECRFCGQTTRFAGRATADVLPASRPRYAIAIAVGISTLLLGVISFYLLSVSSRAIDPPKAAPPAAEARSEAPVTPEPAPTPAAPTPAAPIEPDTPTAADPAIEGEPVVLTWRGKVRQAVGAALRPGAACTLTTKATTDGHQARKEFVSFQCGGQVLYDSTLPLDGMSRNSFGLGEDPLPGRARTFQYVIETDDLGARGGPKAQLTVNSQTGVAEAFRDVAPSFHVYASLERSSQVRSGKPLFAETIPPFEEVVKRKAKVLSRSGSVPFGGASCELVVSPAYHSGDTCRVTVTCGGKVFYGAGKYGFNRCAIVDGKPTTFVDANPTPSGGDPQISADLTAGTATLADTTAQGASYTVSFSLSP